jgi:hypothetical protein
MKPPFILKLAILILFTQFSLHPVAFSQDTRYLEDEGEYLWEEQQFLDVTGEEFKTEDSQYVGDEEVKAAREAAKRAGVPSIDLAAALERDKEMLPDNIMYGIGTGALIGGWFALVEGGNARDNVRYLTIGTLVGALLGVAIGYKSLFTPQGPEISSLMNDPASDAKNMSSATRQTIQPNLFFTPSYVRLNLQILF